MQYRTDPRSGNQLSILGFGMMRLPRGLTGIDQDKTTAMVSLAIQEGINYFDTAHVYAGSEEATGKALAAAGMRAQIFLATKLPHQKCRSYSDFDHYFNEQLTRLQTDYIDYYLIHNLPAASAWQRLLDMGIEGWLKEKQASGQIRQIGFSFHGQQADFLELLEAYDWDFCQIQYNYLDVSFQAGQIGLKAAHEKGMMVVIMEPLRGGKLATGLPSRAVQAMQRVEPQSSQASWAFRWLWNQVEPTVVLSGMGTTEQLLDNLNTAANATAGMLTEEQEKVIDQTVTAIQVGYKVPCTGCNYCMPCPQGVNISGCFAAYNTRTAQGLIAGYMQYFTGTGANRKDRYSGPKNCIACGNCEKQCPQNIAIIESLAEVKKRMEPFWFGALQAAVRRFSA
ncbi:MAG: aldo/keto reductase [Coriobacteriia bacterium]|nr:aldo/keto reductase [Coriobacteriia bacterium]